MPTPYTLRALPPSEWTDKLPELGYAYVPPADGAMILVVEHEDKIVGSFVALNIITLEGLNVHPDYHGNPNVARRLFVGMIQSLKALGVKATCALVTKPDIAALATHAGFTPLEGTVYQKVIE